MPCVGWIKKKKKESVSGTVLFLESEAIGTVINTQVHFVYLKLIFREQLSFHPKAKCKGGHARENGLKAGCCCMWVV